MSLRVSTRALAVFTAGAFFWLAFQWRAPIAERQIHALQGSTMGTTWQVQLATDTSAQQLDTLATELQVLLRRLDKDIFSTWAADSELAQFNRAASGEAHKLTPELIDVLLLSRQLYDESEHSFDISIAPLVDAWGFGPEPVNGIPTTAEIAAARTRLGMEDLQIDAAAGTALRPERLALDVAGIAKGYAVDQLAELLIAAGHADFVVEIGGEIRLQGRRPDGQPWIVAIEAPQGGARKVHARVSGDGGALALAGSGSYRNFREVDGQHFSHELDPRTGYPVSHKLAAVTVIADSAAVADAWATALMVLGPDEGLRLASTRKLAAYFIMHAPAGLESRLTPAFEAFLYEEQGTDNGPEQF